MSPTLLFILGGIMSLASWSIVLDRIKRRREEREEREHIPWITRHHQERNTACDHRAHRWTNRPWTIGSED